MLKAIHLFILVVLSASMAFADDWPSMRGSNGDGIGRSNGSSSLSNASLKVAWKKKLGSGYSSVSIAEGRAYTMYTSGEDDKLGCFDMKSGDTLWEFTIDKKFPGENGSFDGPISTPLIHEGRVFGLSCQGRLVCVTSETGELVWEKKLTEAFEVKQPMYGFSTSPIIAAGNLIVQVGAKDKMLVALDPKSGVEKWACGDDSINSQIPTVMEIDGVPVILAAGGKKLTGVNPESGKIVFEFEHGGGNGSAVMPVSIGGNSVLITVDDAFSKAVNLRPIDEQKVAASEQWQHRSIKNTYNIPTVVDGNVYAFSTRILTCVDPQTGKPHWKSRKPGDGFLIAVDDSIAIVTKEGSVHLAKATSEKYDEIAKLKVFEDLVWTVPSFADGAIFIRSLGEIARIDIVSDSAERNSAVAKSGLPMSKDFAVLLEALKSLEPERANKLVDQFLAEQNSFPIIDSGIAYFVYRGPEDDVALASDIFGARQERKMLPAGNSDLKYYTVKLESDQRANYVFLVNFKPVTDKLNDRKTVSSMYAGEMEFAVRLRNEKPLEMSWFAMDDWKEPAWIREQPKKLNGQLVEKILKGEEEGQESPIDIYLPPQYKKNTNEKFPVIYAYPHMAFESGKFVESADYLFANSASGIRPAIIVVPKGRPAPWMQGKLIPFIEKEFRTIDDRSGRSVAGFGFTGGTVFGAISSKPDQFGAISVQSPLVFGTDAILAGLQNVKVPTRVYIDWGRFDMHNPVENWDLRKSSGEIHAALKEHEHIEVFGGMANDSTDWSSWMNRYDKVLEVLTPASNADGQ